MFVFIQEPNMLRMQETPSGGVGKMRIGRRDK